MIEFLGHKMEVIDGKYYANGKYVCDVDLRDDEPFVFAPKERGESCLMIGPNEPNYGTFLEQKDFLRNVYKLMKTEK